MSQDRRKQAAIGRSFGKTFAVFFVPLLLASWLGPLFVIDLIAFGVTAICLTGLFMAMSGPKWLVRTVVYGCTVLYLTTLFFVLFKALLFDFTGQGFVDEVYYHLSWESFKVGFNEYRWPLTLLFAVMLVFVLLVERFRPRQGFSQGLSVSGLLLLGYLGGVGMSPLGQFLRGFQQYLNTPVVLAIDEDRIQPFVQAGFINDPNLLKKHQITATTDANKNLILIYLESFNQFLVDHPDFNHLTPNLQGLGDDFHGFAHEASAYVTIEGLISSQCGTLLTMAAGNDTFMNKSEGMSQLPCLGDILATAGYEQYYLGGAKMEFAGKGDFLTSHGYDHVWGMEHWRSVNKKSEKNIWGLSDSELLDEAYQVIKQADSKPPYHLTLLTLGTHIPGYTYAGCEAINQGQQFLDAIACTDLLIGRFIKKLEQGGLLDNTLVVIVADHGVFPNPKMTDIFGDLVHDRRLVGITNHRPESPHRPLSSYDLAPTILDWLDVEHNAKFLFGQSMRMDDQRPQAHLTRYRDWVDGQLKNPVAGDCRDDLKPSDALNACEKQYVLSVTQHVLGQFAIDPIAPRLACQVTGQVDLTAEPKQLVIADNNMYEQFHHNGYSLATRQFDSGHFIVALDGERRIINTAYHKIDPKADKPLAHDNHNWALEIRVPSPSEPNPTQLLLHRDQQHKTIPLAADGLFTINLCED